MMLIEVITDPPVGVPLHVIVALDYRDHVSQEVHLVVVENLETIAPVTRESGMIKKAGLVWSWHWWWAKNQWWEEDTDDNGDEGDVIMVLMIVMILMVVLQTPQQADHLHQTGSKQFRRRAVKIWFSSWRLLNCNKKQKPPHQCHGQ